MIKSIEKYQGGKGCVVARFEKWGWQYWALNKETYRITTQCQLWPKTIIDWNQHVGSRKTNPIIEIGVKTSRTWQKWSLVE